MSAGDIRLLHQEAGKESPRMPAWKREILERRKAKGGGSGAGVDSALTSWVNGEISGSSRSNSKDDITSTVTNKNYTITPASQHFPVKRSDTPISSDLSPVKTKDPCSVSDPSVSSSVEGTERANGAQESMVLRESLGPLQENPFIKLEKQRKKQQDQTNASRPVQHILELYSNVPGIRTIHAENIIIIESDPDYFPEGAGLKHASKLQNGTVSGYSSLNDLLDRRGSPVTEIRAKEVVIYDTALSKSEENLSTLGRPGSDVADLFEGQGRVSRMLQKFDLNYGKFQPKSRSTENLLDLNTSPVRSSSRPKALPDMVPKCATPPFPGSPVRFLPNKVSPVFQTNQSSKTKQPASPTHSGSSTPNCGSPQLMSSFWRRSEASGGRTVTINPREEAERSQSKPVRERDWDSTDGATKAKVPCSPESHRARADSPARSTSPSLPRSFEIRPSPHPDLSLVPANDVQARALANLRLQSRNSFTVIPNCRLTAASSPSKTVPPNPVLSPPSQRQTEIVAPVPAVPIPSTPPSTPPLSKHADTVRVPVPANTKPPQLPTPPGTPTSPTPSLKSSPASLTKPVVPVDEASSDKLPITNIDDVVVEPSTPSQSPVIQKRKGNTFTVVPKRKQEHQPSSLEPNDQATVPSPTAAASKAPYAQLGTLLKKRYPAVEEIEVIGGYLSLGRSCLSKAGSTGKKLKISFNESSLQSTFEYPSESSVWDSGEEEEEEEEKGGEESETISTERFSIPRISYTIGSTNVTNSSDLSTYTPKHSVEFSAWQEHKTDNPDVQGEASSQHSDMSEEVMLTPANSSSLSDFSSEPALYF
ncbi:taperin [Chanos chanos]|uniref:Taperin n=1 Tax=Chanos chanos TaxID=29144 RepID=A0A6J2V4A7_CHACN|nr:taperin [Chanos chanos]